MRTRPRARLGAFGLIQTTLLAVLLLDPFPRSPGVRLAADVALGGSVAALLFLVHLLVPYGAGSRVDRWLAVGLLGTVAYAPVRLLHHVATGGGADAAWIGPAVGVVFAAVVSFRRATGPAGAPDLAGRAFGAFLIAAAVAFLSQPAVVMVAAILLQVVVPMRLLARLDVSGSSRRTATAVVLANPFVPGVLFGAVAAAWATLWRLPAPGTLEEPVVVAAFAVAWLLPVWIAGDPELPGS